jgi:hypothetical protein
MRRRITPSEAAEALNSGKSIFCCAADGWKEFRMRPNEMDEEELVLYYRCTSAHQEDHGIGTAVRVGRVQSE